MEDLGTLWAEARAGAHKAEIGTDFLSALTSCHPSASNKHLGLVVREVVGLDPSGQYPTFLLVPGKMGGSCGLDGLDLQV